MMKYVFLIPQPFVSTNVVQVPLKTAPTTWPLQSVVKSPTAAAVTASFYPMHTSLEDEIHRLLISDTRGRDTSWGPTDNDVMEEFRHNGKDYEYLSDEEEAPKHPPRRRKNKKPLPTECVFCKNNGEVASFYKNHILKDAEGKVLCPILRKYKCPICEAQGDNAHTLKYCALNPKPQGVPIVNALKGLRNASGKRRSK